MVKYVLALTLCLVVMFSPLAQEPLPELPPPGGGAGEIFIPDDLDVLTWQIVSDPSSQIVQLPKPPRGNTVKFAGDVYGQGALGAASVVSVQHFGDSCTVTVEAHQTDNLPWLIVVRPVDHTRPAAAVWASYTPGFITPYFSIANERAIRPADILRIVVKDTGVVTYAINGVQVFNNEREATATAPYEVFVQFLWQQPAAFTDARGETRSIIK